MCYIENQKDEWHPLNAEAPRVSYDIRNVSFAKQHADAQTWYRGSTTVKLFMPSLCYTLVPVVLVQYIWAVGYSTPKMLRTASTKSMQIDANRCDLFETSRFKRITLKIRYKLLRLTS